MEAVERKEVEYRNHRPRRRRKVNLQAREYGKHFREYEEDEESSDAERRDKNDNRINERRTNLTLEVF